MILILKQTITNKNKVLILITTKTKMIYFDLNNLIYLYFSINP